MKEKSTFAQVEKKNLELKKFLSALHCRLKFIELPIDDSSRKTIKEMADKVKGA